MFNFFVKRDNELQNILDVISADAARLNVSKLAIEKAVGMIGKAIAKSEIVLQDRNGRRTDKYYYRLNIKPNDNETGTQFWSKAVRYLLCYSECLIVMVKDKYYIAESWQCDDSILSAKRYYDVRLSDGKSTLYLKKTFKADDVIHLKYENAKIRNYLENFVNAYDKTLSAVNTAAKIAALPKFKVSMNAKMRLVEKNEDGSENTITKDQYASKLKRILESDDISLLTMGEGIDINGMKIETMSTVNDISKIVDEEYSTVAMAFDIPVAAFKGQITEKSDATNEFITYAVGPIAEIINDSLNASLVGEEDYIAGERIFVWLAKFRHIDVIDAAVNLDKLRSIGFTLDELFELCGYPQLHTDFSTQRVLTKNYSDPEKDERALGGDPNISELSVKQ